MPRSFAESHFIDYIQGVRDTAWIGGQLRVGEKSYARRSANSRRVSHMSSKQEKNRTPSTYPDFDEMMVLAKEDPDAFEVERQRHIESFLAAIPEEKRDRLTGLQWKVDQVRNLARTPMAACIEISNMMRESLNKLNHEQIRLLKMDMDPLVPLQEQAPVKAKVLPFTRH